jgi:phospholipid/cholesterol/gamma-HCH transport system substrate-binding protein
VRRQIKKQARVFAAVIVLFVAALGIAGYILSNQRFYLPAWFPVLGTDFYEVKAELPTGQAVVPGQGQTVDIAGVKVGEVGSVKLENGHAVVNMEIKNKYKPIYKDATVLLRPKTGLKDMILALDPGNRSAGEIKEGGRIRVGNTLPDVNPDEVLASLDGDTRDYLRILLNAGGTAFRDPKPAATAQAASQDPKPAATRQTASQDLRETFKRFEPTARYGKEITKQLAKRRRNIKHVIHNFQELVTALGAKDKQLAAFVDSSNANFSAFAEEEGSLREALRLFPGALSQTATTLTDVNGLAKELGPTLEGLRPFARQLAPSLRRQRPFLKDSPPIIHNQIRPFARDVQPTVRDLRAATRKLAPAIPGLTRSFGVLDKFFNELAYDPPGAGQSYLFWSAWAAHNGSLLATLQDAHGPMIRGIVLAKCGDFSTLGGLVQANPQLGMLTSLENFPDDRVVCKGTPGYALSLKDKRVTPPPVGK